MELYLKLLWEKLDVIWILISLHITFPILPLDGATIDVRYCGMPQKIVFSRFNPAWWKFSRRPKYFDFKNKAQRKVTKVRFSSEIGKIRIMDKFTQNVAKKCKMELRSLRSLRIIFSLYSVHLSKALHWFRLTFFTLDKLQRFLCCKFCWVQNSLDLFSMLHPN